MQSNSSQSVVLLCKDTQSSRILFHFLKNKIQITAVIFESSPSRVKQLKNRAKKIGWVTVLGQLLFQVLVVPVLSRIAQARVKEILKDNQLSTEPISLAQVFHFDSVNSAECIAQLKILNPAVILVNGTRIISQKVLAATSATVLNTHVGITPQYRGVHGGYWALANRDEKNFGTTFHLVDPGVDTGGVLLQVRAKPTAADNFITYPLLQYVALLPHLPNVIQSVLAGDKKTLSVNTENSKQWYHPTVWSYIWNWVAGVK